MIDDGDTIEALKAVAHPLRMRILRALADAERSVGEIDEAAAIGQPALSQQLAVLRKAGVVTTRREAKLVFYRLDRSRFSTMATFLVDLAGAASAGTSPRELPMEEKAPSSVASFARLG